MTKGWALLALLAALVLLSSSPAAATDFIKVKEYDDAECTEDPARIQTALYPVDTCLIIGKQRMFLHSSNSSLQVFAPPEGRGGRGCVTAPILDEPVTVGDGECLNLDDTLHIKIESLFPEGTYQLSPEENVVNAFTVFCNDPDMTGFNYYGLYNQNQCYTYGLEDGASERFEIKKEENATKIVKTDYKSPNCEEPGTAAEYIVGECSLGHFVFTDALNTHGTYADLAPSSNDPFSADQPNVNSR